jgi:hypothetical protein
MAWVKGQTGNPNGRPKDAVATAIRDSIGASLDLEKLRNSLDELPEGGEYVAGVAKLLPYVLPKLSVVEVVQVGDIEQYLPALSNVELGKLIDAILLEYEKRNSQAEDSEPENKYPIHEELY